MRKRHNEIEDLLVQIQQRKFNILKFVSGLLLASGLIALTLFLYDNYSDGYKEGNLSASLLINSFVIITMFYIYGWGAKKHLRGSALVVTSFLLTVSFLTIMLYGTESYIVYLLIITALLLSSIVISVRFALALFTVSAITVIVLSGVRVFDQDIFSLKRIYEDFLTNFMSLFFVWIIATIAKIGYDQIEHSYSKAADYAGELEAINKALDSKVKQRTKELEESLKRQANAVYSAAVVGSVTRPLLHDIATPLSSFGIALDLLKDPTRKDYKEIHQSAQIAVSQINEIIANGRDLMRNKVKKTVFSPIKLLEISLQILQNEIHANNIEVQNLIDSNIRLYGSPNLFIRVTTNLILNSIQELHNSEKPEKMITIKSEVIKDKVHINIEDTGRGIDPEHLSKIFEPGFTSKNTDTNLGFGLPFIKSTIEEQFEGRIRIKSKVGKFTRIELEFPRTGKKLS